MYTLAEIIAILKSPGFEYESVYGDYDGGKYDPDSSRCIVIAGKK